MLYLVYTNISTLKNSNGGKIVMKLVMMLLLKGRIESFNVMLNLLKNITFTGRVQSEIKKTETDYHKYLVRYLLVVQCWSGVLKCIFSCTLKPF